MELHWDFGEGPTTTQELADLVAKEGRLITRLFLSRAGERCLWGVIEGYVVGGTDGPVRSRQLAEVDSSYLMSSTIGLAAVHNDMFAGTPEKRCVEMARRLRAMP